jgi:hypothetical protein
MGNTCSDKDSVKPKVDTVSVVPSNNTSGSFTISLDKLSEINSFSAGLQNTKGGEEEGETKEKVLPVEEDDKGKGKSDKKKEIKSILKKKKKKDEGDEKWFTLSKEDTSPGGFNYDDVKKIEMLKNDDFADVKMTSYEGKLIPAKIQLHDGDTATICFYHSAANAANAVSAASNKLKYSLRFFGCDAPELKPKKILTFDKKLGKKVELEVDRQHRELEAKAGNHVLKNLNQWIKSINPYSLAWVKFTKNEKFGRLMGHLYIIDPINESVNSPGTKSITKNKLKNETANILTGKELNVVEWLIERKYAKPYFGTKKEEWTKEELNYILSH